ncbi:hypothetical protein SDC9_124924 [bioreactor metagenome]|uniref:Uncharacterized protein n=1 Tax=bioreactor metagenome TaxID=1076179 RepID=A0A645CLY3_9ZZZZ
MHTGEAQLFSPALYFIHQGTDNFSVINEIEPAKTDVFFAPFQLIASHVKGCHAANYLAVAGCQPVTTFCGGKSRITVFAQGVHFIFKKTGNVVRIVLVQGERITNECD